ncbi:MAG: hypothetical protein ACK519_03455 [Sphingomonadaceae bacterium]
MKINANLPCLSALLAAALLLSGCASQQYMGVSLKPGGADPAVQALAARASIGNKQAQYELGRWFEDSTDADGLNKAIKLYQIAATPRGGSRMMYTPGPSGVTTSVVSAGPKIEGNEAAQARLRQLTSSQENQNESKVDEAIYLKKFADRDAKKIEPCFGPEYDWSVTLYKSGSSLIFGIYESDDIIIHFSRDFQNSYDELNIYRYDEDSIVYFSKEIKLILNKQNPDDENNFQSINIDQKNTEYYFHNPIIFTPNDKDFCFVPKPSKLLVKKWMGTKN